MVSSGHFVVPALGERTVSIVRLHADGCGIGQRTIDGDDLLVSMNKNICTITAAGDGGRTAELEGAICGDAVAAVVVSTCDAAAGDSEGTVVFDAGAPADGAPADGDIAAIVVADAVGIAADSASVDSED